MQKDPVCGMMVDEDEDEANLKTDNKPSTSVSSCKQLRQRPPQARTYVNDQRISLMMDDSGRSGDRQASGDELNTPVQCIQRFVRLSGYMSKMWDEARCDAQ